MCCEYLWLKAFGKAVCWVITGWDFCGGDSLALYLFVDVVIFHIYVLGFWCGVGGSGSDDGAGVVDV